jgi:AhpD family alkylhydroperoxidase
MNTRLNLNQIAPDAYKAMFALEGFVNKTSLNKTLRELIKIRASQINGCAYCLDMHTHDARQNGETEQRIYTLNAWRETNFFSDEEQAALALTEEITSIQHHVSDATYQRAVNVLGEQKVAEVLMAAIAINAWNRIAITTELMPALR